MENAAQPANPYGHAANQRRTTIKYADAAGWPAAGRVRQSINADGTLITYNYEAGAFTHSPTPGESAFNPGIGLAVRSTMTRGTLALPFNTPTIPEYDIY